MSGQIGFKVVTPEGTAVEKTVSFTKLMSITGEIGVTPSHTPMLVILKPGKLMTRDINATETTYFVPEGVAHITKKTITIMAPFVEEKKTIDQKRAEAAKQRAEDRIKKPKKETDTARAKASLIRAENRLKVLLKD
ncbi:ATP synthase F1 subunit epsilon [bacterium]|jgi:F-type H+-transporting ATPase subunit epsilon|nr:ATP synthase F1 subunit epsilon [bacterium]